MTGLYWSVKTKAWSTAFLLCGVVYVFRYWLYLYNAGYLSHSTCCHGETILAYPLPRKHKSFVLNWYNVGPKSSALVQHCINVRQNILCLLGSCRTLSGVLVLAATSCWKTRHLISSAAATPTNVTSQQTRCIDPMLGRCWASVVDVGLTLIRHWVYHLTAGAAYIRVFIFY